MNYLKPEGVDFFIHDASAPEKERFLYTHSSRTRKTPLLDQEQPETDFINSKTLEVAGRKWMVVYSATPDFIAARSSWRPWGLLLAGLAFTGLVAGFLLIVSHAEHIEKFAKDLSDVNINLSDEIMERKRAEEKLTESKQMLEDITQGINESILLISKDFRILWANKAALRLTGLSTEELVGNYCYKATHHREQPCEPPLDPCPAYKLLKTGYPSVEEHTHYDKDGNKLFVEVSAYPIRNASSEIVNFVHTSIDVTERKKTERGPKEQAAAARRTERNSGTTSAGRNRFTPGERTTAVSAVEDGGHGGDDRRNCPPVATASQCHRPHNTKPADGI